MALDKCGPSGKLPKAGRKLPLAANSIRGDNFVMTATAVIEQIENLPPEEQSRVIQFAIELARKRQLTGKELAALAHRMVESDDPAEVERLKSALTRGFYGSSVAHRQFSISTEADGLPVIRANGGIITTQLVHEIESLTP